MRFLRILMAGGPLLLYLSVGSCVAPPLHDQIVSPGRDHGNNTNWNDEDASSRFIVFPPTLFFSNYSSKKYAHLPTIYARADRAFKNKPWRTKKEIYYKGKREIYYKAKDCKIYLLHEEGRLLGKGGFGSVHEALDLTTNESIALKIVAAYQSMTRMQKEWTCLKIMDAAVGDYIIGKTWKAVPMKLFKGRSLKHELLAVDHQQHNAFNLTQLYLRAQQQIHLLHSKGYYHGDAHPGKSSVSKARALINESLP